MSDECDTYEGACTRAELLGSAPPSRSEWEQANKNKQSCATNDDVTEVFLDDDDNNKMSYDYLIVCVLCMRRMLHWNRSQLPSQKANWKS